MRDGEASTQADLRARIEALDKAQLECDALKNKLVEAEALLDAKKKKSLEPIAKTDDLTRQLSCLDEHNKKLVEQSGKSEAGLQDCKAKLKELEESLNLDKVIII